MSHRAFDLMDGILAIEEGKWRQLEEFRAAYLASRALLTGRHTGTHRRVIAIDDPVHTNRRRNQHRCRPALWRIDAEGQLVDGRVRRHESSKFSGCFQEPRERSLHSDDRDRDGLTGRIRRGRGGNGGSGPYGPRSKEDLCGRQRHGGERRVLDHLECQSHCCHVEWHGRINRGY